jgi:ATP adenylyltransferase
MSGVGNMETMFAPWRMEYLVCEKQEGCVFCKCSTRCNDYIVFEGKTCFVMLNRYPYVNGHLMIIPQRHLGDIAELTSEERMEMFTLLDISVKVLREAMNPQGFNAGMNLGKAAGAGIAEHVHLHIIPRWEGDTNFISVVGNVRDIPEDLATTAANLAPLFKKYAQEVSTR